MSTSFANRGFSIVRSRKLLVFAMNIIGFISLYMSEAVSVFIAGAFGLACIGAWFWEEPRVNFKRWQTPWTVLTLGLFAWTLIDIFFFAEFFLTSAMYFVIFLAGAKLFQLAENKDFTQSMALSLLLLASGSVLNEQLSFGVAFMAYVFAATVGLTMQHLNIEVSEQHGSKRGRMKIERVIVFSTVGLASLIFVGSLGFFFAFPRVGFGFFVQNNRGGMASSGFGDEVELGGHGTIRENAQIVMRVRFPNDPPSMPGALYFRGLSLDHYNGRGWRDEDDQDNRELVDRDRTGPGYRIGDAVNLTWDEAIADTIVSDVYLEPLDTDVLFAVGRFRALGLPDDVTELPDHWFDRSLAADATGQVTLSQRSQQGVMYRAYSRENVPTLEELRAARYPREHTQLVDSLDAAYLAALERAGEVAAPAYDPLAEDSLRLIRSSRGEDGDGPMTDLAEHYLQLPEEQETPRLREMVDRLRAGAPLDVDFALAVQEELRALTYTTDLPQPSGPDANLVDEFVFEWQRGHCEYFATAMVVLLRMGGVPARIVNGFLGADYNPVGDFYAVRQANAHSWVEVYFPGAGWVRFDPTPAGAPDFGGDGPLVRIQQFIDNMRLTWFRWVVEYDLEKQFNAVRNAVDALGGEREGVEQSETRQDLRDWVEGVMRWVLRRAAAFSLFFLVWLTAAAVFRRRSIERVPWGIVDNAVGVGWAVLATAIAWRWWPEFDLAGALATYVPVAVTVFVAWQLRQDLFSVDVRKGRSRGGDFVSTLYARLLRTIERELGELPLSLSASELPAELDLRDPEAARELQAFVTLYEEVRFAGRALEPDQEVAWRSRFRVLSRAVVRDLRAQLKAEARDASRE